MIATAPSARKSPRSGDDRSPARRRGSVRRVRLARPRGCARQYSKIRGPVNRAGFTYVSKEESGGIPDGITACGRKSGASPGVEVEEHDQKHQGLLARR